jgi:hypothetical protein
MQLKEISAVYFQKNIKAIKYTMHVTAAEWSEAWTVFVRSEAGIVGSNHTQGMDIWYVYLLSFV